MKQKTAFCSVIQLQKYFRQKPLTCDLGLTPVEMRYCISKKNSAEPAAARIAAKKAVLSLLKVPASRRRQWMHEIQINKKRDGKPCLYFSLRMKKKFKLTKKEKWFLSLAHERNLAVAWVACVAS